MGKEIKIQLTTKYNGSIPDIFVTLKSSTVIDVYQWIDIL